MKKGTREGSFFYFRHIKKNLWVENNFAIFAMILRYGTDTVHLTPRHSHRCPDIGTHGAYRHVGDTAHAQQGALAGLLYRCRSRLERPDLLSAHRFLPELYHGLYRCPPVVDTDNRQHGAGGFGLYLYRKNPTRALKTAVPAASNYWSDFATGFLLTFSNPLILFFIIGLFARFNFILPEFEIHHHILAYTTIFGGALLWWYGVTSLVSHLGKRINVRSLKLINRIIALVLMGMAVLGVVMALLDKHF